MTEPGVTRTSGQPIPRLLTPAPLFPPVITKTRKGYNLGMSSRMEAILKNQFRHVSLAVSLTFSGEKWSARQDNLCRFPKSWACSFVFCETGSHCVAWLPCNSEIYLPPITGPKVRATTAGLLLGLYSCCKSRSRKGGGRAPPHPQ